MKQRDLNKEQFIKRFTYKKAIPFELPNDTKFQVIQFEPNKIVPNHWHKKTLEIYLVLEGAGTLYINDAPYPLRTNLIYLIEPGNVHRIHSLTPLKIAIFKPLEVKDDIYWQGGKEPK